MRKKEIILIAVLLLVGGLYVTYFTNWFAKKRQIGIDFSVRPAPGAPVTAVVFKLDGDYRLTKLKVVPLDSDSFKPQATASWDLVAAGSNSAPTRMIVYGRDIPGMKPAFKGTRADPLDPNLVYRMELAAGEVTGTVDFRAMPQRR